MIINTWYFRLLGAGATLSLLMLAGCGSDKPRLDLQAAQNINNNLAKLGVESNGKTAETLRDAVNKDCSPAGHAPQECVAIGTSMTAMVKSAYERTAFAKLDQLRHITVDRKKSDPNLAKTLRNDFDQAQQASGQPLEHYGVTGPQLNAMVKKNFYNAGDSEGGKDKVAKAIARAKAKSKKKAAATTHKGPA